MQRIGAAILVAVAFGAAGQQNVLPPYIETLEVRINNIDAVVTDRAGNPVTGLARSDFEVLEEGKPQRIQHFYLVTEHPTTASAKGSGW